MISSGKYTHSLLNFHCSSSLCTCILYIESDFRRKMFQAVGAFWLQKMHNTVSSTHVISEISRGVGKVPQILHLASSQPSADCLLCTIIFPTFSQTSLRPCLPTPSLPCQPRPIPTPRHVVNSCQQNIKVTNTIHGVQTSL